MPHPFLCRFRPGGGTVTSSPRGVVHDRELGELEHVAHAIFAPQVSVGKAPVGLPDVWSRALLFEDALMARAEPHPMRDQVVGEWRGILALLAFRKHPNYERKGRLTKTVVDVGSANLPRCLRSFTDHTLAPAASPEDHRRLYVFRWDGKPFATTWPATYFFSGVDYSGLADVVPWYNGEFFEDPTGYLNPNERELLSWWLEEVRVDTVPRAADAADPRHTNPYVPVIASELTDFMTNLVGDADIEPDPTVFVERGWDDGPLESPYLPLNRAVVRPPGPSDVELDHSRKQDATKILLVDHAIPISTGVPARDIHVTGGVNLDTALAQWGPGPATIEATPLPGGEQWGGSDAFFTDVLVLVERPQDDDPFHAPVAGFDGNEPTTAAGDAFTAILPVQSWLLDYLSPEEICERARLVETSEGEWRCELQLDLVGGLAPVTIHHSYSEDEGTAQQSRIPPLLEIWPNFSAPDWIFYSTYCQNVSDTQERSVMATPCADVDDAEQATWHAGPQSAASKMIEICRVKAFPEAFACTFMDEKRVPKACGLLLIPRPPATASDVTADAVWDVAVDFGTTGTHISYRQGAGDVADSPIKDRRVQLAGAQVHRTRGSVRFAPLGDLSMPVPSTFHAPSQADGIHPFTNGNVFVTSVLGDDRPTDGVFSEDNLRHNLKWSRDRGELGAAEKFLKQLCLHICAEARSAGVAQIRLRFTYPTAFPVATRTRMHTWWQRIAEQVGAVTGCDLSIPNAPIPESVAAARYFRTHMAAPLTVGTVCVDIGGGSTDLSFWEQNELCSHVSVLYAGRDVFLDALRECIEVLDLVTDDPRVDAQWRLFTTSEVDRVAKLIAAAPPVTPGDTSAGLSRWYFYADSLLRLSQERAFSWAGFLNIHYGEPIIQRLIQQVRLGLSGLMYYIGFYVRRLSAENQFHRRLPEFFVGGNGARMFDWAAGGQYTDDGTAAGLFRHVLAAATESDDESRFRITVSNRPKTEASWGALEPAGPPHDIGEASQPLAGDDFLWNGAEQASSNTMSTAHMVDGVEPTDAMPELRRFLDAYNDFADGSNSETKRIDIDDDTTPNFEDVVVAAIEDLSRQVGTPDADTVRVAPVFIAELRALLFRLRAADYWS